MDAEVDVEHLEHAAALSYFFSEGLAAELRKTAGCHQIITEMAIIEKTVENGQNVDQNTLTIAQEMKRLFSS